MKRKSKYGTIETGASPWNACDHCVYQGKCSDECRDYCIKYLDGAEYFKNTEIR